MENLFTFWRGDVLTIKKKFEKCGLDFIDLLEKMLALDPNKRPSAIECMEHPYFKNKPLPSSNESIAKAVKDFKMKGKMK